MDCNQVREQLDARPSDAVTAHLQDCAACRAEAAFRGRLTAALTAMPRAAAPDALMARVMADVQNPSPWGLRAWEMVGLAAACLLLLLVPMGLGLIAWSPGAALAPGTLAGWFEALQTSLDAALRDGQRTLAHGLAAMAGSTRGLGTGVPLIAGVAVAAFALALALLLSWRGSGIAPGEESARA
jgi:hypothetical protein